jgi:MFS family permease
VRTDPQLEATEVADRAVPRRQPLVFAPFAYRDFRLLWSGLIVSNLGTWMQFTALGYVIVQLAPTPRLASVYAGLLGASIAVPVLLVSPFAGVFADVLPRRRILFWSNGAFIAIALALGFMLACGKPTVWQILILASLRGVVSSFDAPARQSWVPLIVPREIVGNAIGLNGIAFNAPSVLGPPLAGILILSTGAAASFFINAVLTLAVVIALIFMKPVPASSTKREPVFASIDAGLRFLFNHPILRWVIALLTITCVLVRPYAYLLPAYAQHVAHVDARGFGIMLGASGLGAICGATISAILGSRRRGIVWFGGAALMSLASLSLAVYAGFWVSLLILFILGFAAIVYANSSNVLLQMLSPDDMRGRAISVFSMIVLGVIPLGSLVLGTVAGLFGLEKTLSIAGAISLVAALVIFIRHPALRSV